MSLLTYVVITPARNEAQFIELTLKSMVAQTVRPVKWVIVSDGSTDGTDEVVRRYMEENSWIELLRMPERQERHFAGKVLAFNAGYAKAKAVAHDVVVSLDGDTSFGADYFEFLLGKLSEDPALGLVGTPFEEAERATYDYRFVSVEHVSGACQVFRRECFEGIGGYVPVKGGGIDHIAVLTARMKGWKTRTFLDKLYQHHRRMGTAQRGRLAARFRFGIQDHALGGHPLWEIFRVFYQMTNKPYLLGGTMLGVGYFWAMVSGAPRPISPELVAFRRREQMQRLKRFLTRSAAPVEPRLERAS